MSKVLKVTKVKMNVILHINKEHKEFVNPAILCTPSTLGILGTSNYILL